MQVHVHVYDIAILLIQLKLILPAFYKKKNTVKVSLIVKVLQFSLKKYQ